MIIMLSTDEETVGGMRDLSRLYPEETVYRLEQIIELGHDLSSCVEKPIKRITVLGHAENNIFGQWTAQECANYIKYLLQLNEEKTPGFIRQLEAIDFLGCEVGNINKEGQGYMIDVAEYLGAHYIDIPLYAFTPRVLDSEQQPFYGTLLRKCAEEPVWDFLAFTTEADENSYFEKVDEYRAGLDRITQIKDEIYTDTQQWSTLYIENIEYKDLIVDCDTDLIPDIRECIDATLEGMEVIADHLITLKSEIQQVELQQQALAAIIRSYTNMIVSTSDPRVYFASQARCNFRSTIAQSQTFKDNMQDVRTSAPIQGQVEIDHIENDESKVQAVPAILPKR